jgi:hypothetical protein
MEGRLLAGRLMADVPRRAKGFVVSTAVAKIEDLGTRFGVEVDEAAGSLVHVYLGRVDVHGGMENGRWIRQLAAGQSLRIGPALDASEATSADRDSFAELFEVYEPIVATFAEGLPRLASDGWAGGWNTLFDADAVSLGGPSIEIKSPLSPTGAEYLACSLLGEKELSSSNRSAGFGFVFRRYGPQGRIDLSLPHEISFRYRLETPLSDGANRLRTAMLYDDSQLEEGVASATNTWAIRAYSESVDGVPAGHWTFVGGSESRGRLKRVDSTMPLVAGKVYAIRLRIWPKQREWDASISDGERTVGSATAAGEQMRFRTNSTRAGGVLHFGGRIKNPGERLEFSIDDLRIQRISWTERLSTQ